MSNPLVEIMKLGQSIWYDNIRRAFLSVATCKRRSTRMICAALVIDDIARAADILKPVYHKTDGIDGYISLEVSPRLAYETQGTIEEADRLFKRLGRRNVMIKIPAAQEGLPAIEEAIYRGINVNVTMIFSIENYEQV